MKLIRKYTIRWTNPSPQTTQTTHRFSAKGILEESWGRSMHFGVIKDYRYKKKLGIPHIIYSATQVVLLVVWIKL
jgi:hypothetical protein